MCKKRNFLFPFIFSCLFIIFIVFSLFLFLLSITSCSSKEKALKELTDENLSKEEEVHEVSLPEYSGFVNDFTNTLDKSWLAKTESVVYSVEHDTTCEIAVAVVESLGGMTVEEYAFRLFNKWGVGKKDKDNGVLLLVALKERELKIEVGYGLEETITDIKAKEIIEDVIVPRFKAGDYNSGIYNGVVAIANTIYREYGKAEIPYSDTVAPEAPKRFTQTIYFERLIIGIVLTLTIGPWVVFALVIGIGFLVAYIKLHKCPKCRRLGLITKRIVIQKPNYFYPGKAIVEKSCRYCDYYESFIEIIPKLSIVRYSSSGYSGSSSWRSSSSSSSFSSSHSSSSFGGGSSGGGGASGRW